MLTGKGFTLIELLIVIVIIALLMVILMSALQRIRIQAKAVKCHANLRQLSLAVNAYTAANERRFFPEWLHIHLEGRHTNIIVRIYCVLSTRTSNNLSLKEYTK